MPLAHRVLVSDLAALDDKDVKAAPRRHCLGDQSKWPSLRLGYRHHTTPRPYQAVIILDVDQRTRLNSIHLADDQMQALLLLFRTCNPYKGTRKHRNGCGIGAGRGSRRRDAPGADHFHISIAQLAQRTHSDRMWRILSRSCGTRMCSRSMLRKKRSRWSSSRKKQPCQTCTTS